MSDYLSLFTHRNFTLMTVADAVSVLGDQIGWVALLWFAMVTIGHSGAMGALALAFGLPGVLLGAFVGNILDRTSHKKILVAANLLLGVVFMTIPLLYQMHVLSLPVLVVLVAIAGCLTPFTSVGWMVIVPKLVAEESLGLANSVVETIWNGASLLGPLAGGLLIARLGAPMAVLADGLSFWLAALCVWLIKEDGMDKARSSPGSAEGADHSRASFIQQTGRGVKVLYSLKGVWWITLGAVFINLAYGQLEVSLPLFTHNELSRSAVILGSFWTMYFISSLVGSALSGLLSKNQRRHADGLYGDCMGVQFRADDLVPPIVGDLCLAGVGWLVLFGIPCTCPNSGAKIGAKRVPRTGSRDSRFDDCSRCADGLLFERHAGRMDGAVVCHWPHWFICSIRRVRVVVCA